MGSPAVPTPSLNPRLEAVLAVSGVVAVPLVLVPVPVPAALAPALVVVAKSVNNIKSSWSIHHQELKKNYESI